AIKTRAASRTSSRSVSLRTMLVTLAFRTGTRLLRPGSRRQGRPSPARLRRAPCHGPSCRGSSASGNGLDKGRPTVQNRPTAVAWRFFAGCAFGVLPLSPFAMLGRPLQLLCEGVGGRRTGDLKAIVDEFEGI